MKIGVRIRQKLAPASGISAELHVNLSMNPKKYNREITRRQFVSSTVKAALILSVLPKIAKAAENGQFSRPNFTYLKDLLNPFRQANGWPSLAAAVMKNGVVVASGAVGIRKVGDATPVTMLDRFHLGSCTKAFTATLAAMVVEEGKIRWNSTLLEIFPERAAQLQNYGEVTLELLLWHRAGVPDGIQGDWWKTYTDWCSAQGIPPGAYPQDEMDPRIIMGRLEYMDLALSQPPDSKSGTTMHYSNNNYIIAGCMIERVTGLPWEDLIRQRLFRPLGMSSAGFGPCQRPDQTDQPWGHSYHSKEGRFVPKYGDNPEVMGPSSTVHCALIDYLKFVDLHTSEGRRGPRLLGQAAFAKLHTHGPEQDYAMGWDAAYRSWEGGRVLMHTGSNTMNYILAWAAPKTDLSLVVATNCAGKSMDAAVDEIATTLVTNLSPPETGWISSAVPAPGADGWIVLFDGKRLYGCSPTAADIESYKVKVEDGCLRLRSAAVGFNLNGRNFVIRARLKKGQGQSFCSLFVPGRKSARFYGGDSFGIGKVVDGQYQDLITGHSRGSKKDFFEMELYSEAGNLALTVDGQKVCDVRDDSAGEEGAIGVSARNGITMFKSIDARILDKQ